MGIIRKLAHWRETGGGDRSCRETGGGDRSCRETGGGDRSCRETDGGARLAAVIEATNSSFLDPIGMWTLSLKCDGEHYRTVGTIAGELTLSQKYNGEHYRIVGTIAGDLTLSLGTDTIAKKQR